MKLFHQPYERALWLKTLHDCFPDTRPFSQPQAIKTGETDHFFYLGKITTRDEKSLGLYEIETRESTQLARNRVQLRQMIAKQCEIGTFDGALAAYWDKQGQWRFSFISIQYRLDEKGKLLKEETASKRYTYLVGKGMQTRTVQERFNQLPENPTLQDLTNAFAVEPLNKEFYNKIYRWYDDAKQHVVFPNDEGIDKDTHQSNSLIRLLTRLLFVWFIKEKGLVNPDMFDRNKLPQIIDWNQPDSYYKAILQNLFFATLNRNISDRKFRTDTKGKPNNTNYLAGNIYRYRDRFLKTKKEGILALFEQTPFLNGGLFECLDREASDEEKQNFDADKSLRRERNAIRIDGFSDCTDNTLDISNNLFFNEQKTGLIDLLGQYQFTVEESTPLDEKVALDPELLGKMFENLLADVNPKIQASDRKASGSYYTPRKIVSYMVDESLKAYLKQSLSSMEPLNVDHKINELFWHTDQATGVIPDNLLTDTQKKHLIEAIHRIKILDPAVGSGAFPMGALQRLVSLLRVLDPDNKQWRNQQLSALPELADIEADLKTADEIHDAKARQKAEEELSKRQQEIKDSFNNRNHDYSRKLYLIENSIFGVDIQSIAIQICKLRFFIALAIEQTPTDNRDDNYGIRALPNLETRFVAADTLRDIRGEGKQELCNPDSYVIIQKKEKELNQIRRHYFNACTLKTKQKCREQDSRLRRDIVTLLMDDGWQDADAHKIAAWDPYNQSASPADWFDAEYMFGVDAGFDVVIGNPPYINLQKNAGTRCLYQNADFEAFVGSGDIYCLFYEKSMKLLKNRGYMCFITSNKWMRSKYGEKLRRFFMKKTKPVRLLDFGGFQVFESATVDTNILLAQAIAGDSRLLAAKFENDFSEATHIEEYVKEKEVLITVTDAPWIIGSCLEMRLKEKIERIGTPLKDWDISINRGILTGYNKAFIIDNKTKEALIREDPKSADILKPVLRGRDIKRYQAQWAGLWLIDSHNGYGHTPPIDIDDYPAIKRHMDKFYPQLKKRQDKGVTPYNLRNCTYHAEFEKEKIVYPETAQSANFIYDFAGDFYAEKTCFILMGKNLAYLTGLMSSKLLAYIFSNYYSGVSLSDKGYQYNKHALNKLPVAPISSSNCIAADCIQSLVNKIISEKTCGHNTRDLEIAVDKKVYEIYELTDEEIKTVESIWRY